MDEEEVEAKAAATRGVAGAETDAAAAERESARRRMARAMCSTLCLCREDAAGL
jgi:hypothetical protein